MAFENANGTGMYMPVAPAATNYGSNGWNGGFGGCSSCSCSQLTTAGVTVSE